MHPERERERGRERAEQRPGQAEADGSAFPGHREATRVAPPPLLPPRPPPPQQTGDITSCRVAAGPQSRHLHSFSFPSMSWGTHRLLRCVKLDPPGVPSSSEHVPTAENGSLLARRRTLAEEGARGGGNGERVGEDERLRRFREAMMGGSRREGSKGDLAPCPPPAGEQASKPWNLRLRRAAACSVPEKGVLGKAKTQDQTPIVMAAAAAGKCSKRVRRGEAGAQVVERPRFSVALSKEEIEVDFLLMTGSRPPRRPKKRPRNAQKQVDVICPGFYLTEITPDLYKTS